MTKEQAQKNDEHLRNIAYRMAQKGIITYLDYCMYVLKLNRSRPANAQMNMTH